MKTDYPGISKIYRFPKSYLPFHLRGRAILGATCVIPSIASEVAFYGIPQLTSTTQQKNGEYTITAILIFYTTEDIHPDDSEAWGVQTAAGDCYVIGAIEAPAPDMQIASDTSTPTGSARGSKVQISHTGKPAKAIIR